MLRNGPRGKNATERHCYEKDRLGWRGTMCFRQALPVPVGGSENTTPQAVAIA
jgi:hypothetical protein